MYKKLEIRLSKSKFVEIPICNKCNYFTPPNYEKLDCDVPYISIRFVSKKLPSQPICPKCGSILKLKIGRYITEYYKTKHFFGLLHESHSEIIGFE